MARMIRREKLPVWASLILAALLYPLVFLLIGITLQGTAEILHATGALTWAEGSFIEVLLPAAFLGAGLGLPYVVCRLIYSGLRFEVIAWDGKRCWNCRYDLTGNVSGTCPECGEEASAGMVCG